MIRIQVLHGTVDVGERDSSVAVRDAIESKILRLRFALAKSEKNIAAVEGKYHFQSSDLPGKTVEDLGSHQDYQEWQGELYVRDRIFTELNTLEHKEVFLFENVQNELLRSR